MPCEGCGRPIAQTLPICPLCGHRRAGFVTKEVAPEPAPKVDPVLTKELPKEARAKVLLLMHAEAAKSVETVRTLGLAERVLTFLVWPAIVPGMIMTFSFVRSRGNYDSFWNVGAGVLTLGYFAFKFGGVAAVLLSVPLAAWIARGILRIVAKSKGAGL